MKNMPCASVFIAMSLDGFIAAKDNGLEWLEMVNSPGEDYGYSKFISSVDALLIGRKTYDVVRSFTEWPYGGKKVAVLTHRIFEPIKDEVQVSGDLRSVLEDLGQQGVKRVYLDGGQVIQAGIREGLVSDMTISVIPILLGDGIPLFGILEKSVQLRSQSVTRFDSGLVQLIYEVMSEEKA